VLFNSSFTFVGLFDIFNAATAAKINFIKHSVQTRE